MEIGNIVRINRGSSKGEETTITGLAVDGRFETMLGTFKAGTLTFVAANEDVYLEMSEMTANPEALVTPESEGAVMAELSPCLCNCGELAGKKARFIPGHDQKLRSRLLIEFDHGSYSQRESAAERLMNLGWYTLEQLEDREHEAKEASTAKADRLMAKRDKLAERIAKLSAELDELDIQIEVELFRTSR